MTFAVTITRSSTPGSILAPELLDGHLLVGLQLHDLPPHRRRILPRVPLLRRDGRLIVRFAVAVEVAVGTLDTPKSKWLVSVRADTKW